MFGESRATIVSKVNLKEDEKFIIKIFHSLNCLKLF